MVVNASSEDEWRGLSFNVSNEDIRWLQGAYVGKTFSLEIAFDIQKNLHLEGISSIKVVPLCGNLVLLARDREEDISMILNDFTDTISKCFEEIRPWDLGYVGSERLVLLNVTSVPTNAFK